MEAITGSLTSILNDHINFDQTISIDSGSIFVSLAKMTGASVSARLNETGIRFPSILHPNVSLLLRVSLIDEQSLKNDLFITRLQRNDLHQLVINPFHHIPISLDYFPCLFSMKMERM